MCLPDGDSASRWQAACCVLCASHYCYDDWNRLGGGVASPPPPLPPHHHDHHPDHARTPTRLPPTLLPVRSLSAWRVGQWQDEAFLLLLKRPVTKEAGMRAQDGGVGRREGGKEKHHLCFVFFTERDMDSPLVSLKKLAVLGPHRHSAASFFIKSQLQFSPKLRGGGLRDPGGLGGLEGGGCKGNHLDLCAGVPRAAQNLLG